MKFDWAPLFISLRSSLLALVLVFFLGIGAARLLLYACRRTGWLADVLFSLPMVLPPTVTGYFLLILLGRNSPLGRFLGTRGISLIFTWQATVAAAVVVSFPLMYRAARGSLEQVDQNLIHAARTLGMGEFRLFLKIMIPEAWPGIAAGTALAFARALGEFGATVMLAGNIPGRTQTIPLAIYFATAGGNMRGAGIWALLITLVSCLILGVMNFFNHRQNLIRRGNR